MTWVCHIWQTAGIFSNYYEVGNMNRTMAILSLIAFISAVCLPVAAVEKLWVNASDAKLKAERKSSSETVAKLPIGTELKVLSFEKRWYEVSTKDGKGWIYRGKVSDTPPEESEGGDGLIGDLADSRIKADSIDDSRSVRGLSPEAKEYAKSAGTPKECQDALDEVLALQISGKDIEIFLKGGKIGEYAE